MCVDIQESNILWLTFYENKQPMRICKVTEFLNVCPNAAGNTWTHELQNTEVIMSSFIHVQHRHMKVSGKNIEEMPLKRFECTECKLKLPETKISCLI